MLNLTNYFLSKNRYGWTLGLLFCFNGCVTDAWTDFSKVVASKEIPILSNEQAINYAKLKYFSEYKNPVVPQSSGGFGIWKIKALEKFNSQGAYWFVQIRSSGVIPSYSCTAAFNSEGQWVNDPSSRCGWNK